MINKILISLIIILISIGAEAAEYSINIGYIDKFSFNYSHTKTMATLKNAERGDIIRFSIHSTGGRVDMMYDILSGLKRTKAKTYMYVSQAYSAAAIIALAGDRLYVRDGARFMFHLAGYTHPLFGHRVTLDLNDKRQKKFIRTLKKYAFRYLTGSEERRILSGKDVFIPGKVIKNRR